MTDEQKNAIEHAQKILRAVKLYSHADLIAESEASAEPVAWFDAREGDYSDNFAWGERKPSFTGDWQPLYTRPARAPAASIADTAGAKPIGYASRKHLDLIDERHPALIYPTAEDEWTVPVFAAPPASSVADAHASLSAEKRGEGGFMEERSKAWNAAKDHRPDDEMKQLLFVDGWLAKWRQK